jgi:hypothetical protein
MSKWCDIKTAPKDGSDILACGKSGEMFVVFWHVKEWLLILDAKKLAGGSVSVSDLTNWMPLPSPPEAK